MVIWKFPIDPQGEFVVKAPTSLRVLSTGVQGGQPFFWASLNPKDPEYIFKFRVVMTGEDFPDDVADPDFWRFHGTLQLMSGIGPIVIHLFQKIPG